MLIAFDVWLERELKASRWVTSLKVKHARDAIALDAATVSNLSSEVMHHIALAKHELNLALAQLEREGV
jgi:hypothetical protein